MPKTPSKDHKSEFVIESQLEELLSDQTSTILEAVDDRLERSEKKVDKRFDEVISHIDSVLKEVVTLRDEETIGAGQLRRHADELKDHESRIKRLEAKQHA